MASPAAAFCQHACSRRRYSEKLSHLGISQPAFAIGVGHQCPRKRFSCTRPEHAARSLNNWSPDRGNAGRETIEGGGDRQEMAYHYSGRT